MTTRITRRQIEDLRIEAGAAGDTAMVEICRRAEEGRDTMAIIAHNPRFSEACPDDIAVDVDVIVTNVEDQPIKGTVTLIHDRVNGGWTRWGSVWNWASQELHTLGGQALQDVAHGASMIAESSGFRAKSMSRAEWERLTNLDRSVLA